MCWNAWTVNAWRLGRLWIPGGRHRRPTKRWEKHTFLTVEDHFFFAFLCQNGSSHPPNFLSYLVTFEIGGVMSMCQGFFGWLVSLNIFPFFGATCQHFKCKRRYHQPLIKKIGTSRWFFQHIFCYISPHIQIGNGFPILTCFDIYIYFRFFGWRFNQKPAH